MFIYISILGLMAVGLAVLIFGGEYLVRGASSVAKKFGISPLVIGLTIVAFGTSAPELVVNMVAAFSGNTDIALGNIIGSNIVNVLIILGVSAVIAPIAVARTTIWKEIPFAWLASVVVLFLGYDTLLAGAADNMLTRGEGLTLIAFFGIFMYYVFSLAASSPEAQEDVVTYPTSTSYLYILGGLVALFFGGKLFVSNAIELATMLGVPEMIIGLTIVAIGTSLPELVTSIIAARKGHSDIAIGNVVGSNIFNIFWILGLTATITPVPIPTEGIYDIAISILVSTLLFAFMFMGKKASITRSKGILLIVGYAAYVFYVITR